MGDNKIPGDDIAILHQEIGRIFRDFFSEDGLFDRVDLPPVDIIETEKSLRIEVEIPGIEKADVKLEISENNLIIEGTKRDCEKVERTNYVCMERRFGYFKRIVTLPLKSDPSRIKAHHEKGILTITLPKVCDRRGSAKTIDIE